MLKGLKDCFEGLLFTHPRMVFAAFSMLGRVLKSTAQEGILYVHSWWLFLEVQHCYFLQPESLIWPAHFLQCAGGPSHLILSSESPRLSPDTASPLLKGEQTILKTWMWTKSHSSGEPIPVLCSMHGLRLRSASSCPYNPGRSRWNQLLCLKYWIVPSMSHAQRSSKLQNPGISSFVPELRLVIRSSSSR